MDLLGLIYLPRRHVGRHEQTRDPGDQQYVAEYFEVRPFGTQTEALDEHDDEDRADPRGDPDLPLAGGDL